MSKEYNELADIVAAMHREREQLRAECARLRLANAVLRAACNVLWWQPTKWERQEVRSRAHALRAAALRAA